MPGTPSHRADPDEGGWGSGGACCAPVAAADGIDSLIASVGMPSVLVVGIDPHAVPGMDGDSMRAVLDQELSRFLATGPTPVGPPERGGKSLLLAVQAARNTTKHVQRTIETETTHIFAVPAHPIQ